MGRMNQQRLCGQEDGYSRHGRLAVFAENPPITPAGHTRCDLLPLGDERPFLAARISVTRVLFLFFVRNRAGWASFCSRFSQSWPQTSGLFQLNRTG
jgi:hypothetical protein